MILWSLLDPRRSFRAKILLFASLLVLIPGLAITAVVFFVGEEAIIQEQGNRLTSATALKRQGILNWFDEIREEVAALASSPYVIRDLQHADSTGAGLADLREALAAYAQAAGDLLEVFVMDDAGIVIASSDPAQEGKTKAARDYFQDGLIQPGVQKFYHSVTLRRPALTFSRPIQDARGRTLGVLAARVNLLALNRLTREYAGLGQSGDSYLVNRYNLFVSEPRLMKEAAFTKTIYTDGVRQCLAGQSGVSRYTDYRDIMVLGAYSWLADYDLCVLAEMDVSELLAPVKRFSIVALQVLGTGFVLALAAALLISGWVTRPILILSRAADSLTDGDLAHRVNLASRDEVGHLATAFNRLGAQLKANDERIEAQLTDLRSSRQAAEEALRVKSEFLAHMSHEIRTPMNAILGLSELALQQTLTPLARDYLAQVHAAGEQLLHILNDILDQSKLDSGRLNLDRVAFAVETILERLRSLFAPVAKTKGLTLVIAAEPRVPAALIGDPQRLLQVLTNLLSNALKFTHQGEVRLHVSRLDGDDGNPRLRWVVSDTGIGMDEETLSRLFTPYTQGDSSIARRFGGTGLGLSISRHLASLMGGTLTVSSTPATGSVFTLEMPFEVAEADAIAPDAAASAPEPADFAGVRILVAEDQALNQRVVGDMLRLLGITACFAADGGEALEQLNAEPFDLVLMDIQMPKVDGLTATRRIRDNPAWVNLPVIALTAGVTTEERERIQAAGCNALLPKPIRLTALENTLRRWLRESDAQPQADACDWPESADPIEIPDPADLTPEPANGPIIDTSQLAHIIDDPEDLHALLHMFADSIRNSLEVIANQFEAGDHEQTRQQLHRLKGVAANVGAHPLHAVAEAFEQDIRHGASGDLRPRLEQLRRIHADTLAWIDQFTGKP